MVWQSVRTALLFGAALAVAVSSARADCCTPAPCGPTMRTITETVCVPETYTTTRTAYKYECKQETYTAYKTECVPETRTRVCTVYKRVPEMKTVVHNVCVKVPCVEERCVMKRHWETQTCTRMVCKTVDRGHWECKEVPCRSFSLGGLFGGHGCGGCGGGHHGGCGGCGDSCNQCESCCVPTRTVKCWVPCKETIQCPVTTCKRVCVQVPTKVCCTVYKTETRQECKQVCCYRCVPEQKTECYTVQVKKCVPYQACRTVRVCVPYQETVTCCRMVQKCVTRQVPCAPAPACPTPCATPCSSCGNECCGASRRCFSGLFHRERGCGCNSGCGCN